MAVIGGVGSFASWNGGCVLIGRGATIVPMHSHYAIQIAFGSELGIAFRSTEHEDWTSYGGALIPSRQPHSMNVTKVPANAVLFVEPETREGRVLNERFLAGGIAPMPDETLETAFRVFPAWETGEEKPLADACVAVISALTGELEPRVESDPRILRAITYINQNLGGKLTLEEVSAEAFLSPGRFRHLFVEQTGLGLRPYILWRRFIREWELVAQGESMSTAAHRAGFADAAHLSRTSRRMFGFPPSALRVAGPPTNDR